MNDFSKMPIGTKVWDVGLGEGVISSVFIEHDYPVEVQFKTGLSSSYTIFGLYFKKSVKPTLFPYPVEVVRIKQKVRKYKVVIKEPDESLRVSEGYYYSLQDFNESYEADSIAIQLIESEFIEEYE